ncbi:MAG: phosphopentomutase [Clostridia bacterium]|nr:phosphopentomutase [Clostridia bacterium]
MRVKRVFLIVLDSCGVGQAPDAEAFGDRNCNTLKRISASPRFRADNMKKMGLGNIEGCDYIGVVPDPSAAVGRLKERSAGKDTTTGHWEMAGLISNKPMPTFPEGFPKTVIKAFEKAVGRGTLCNRPYSGTDVIRDFGREHIETGKLIVYTSADSVFQIAAHENVVPVEQLYEYCRAARKILTGPYAVGRVIARPFVGTWPDFTRTAKRHDFSLTPPEPTMLDAIKDAGRTVYAIGKIQDIFAGRGISSYVYTQSNADGMRRTLEAQDMDFEGLCFTNLVDMDSKFGHRQDVDGYANAFAEFDCWLPGFVERMRKDDILMITADHGCDPGDDSTDHTREYVPWVVYGDGINPVGLGTGDTFADIAATVTDCLGVPFSCAGRSRRAEIERK